MTIHNELFSSQDTLLRTASIHDTPSVKDAPDPIAIDHVSLYEIGELEADKVYEPASEILFSASIKDDLYISEQVEAVIQTQEIAIEKRIRKLTGKASKSKQQRRRDAIEARKTQINDSKKNKSYKKSYKKKKPWTAKTLPTAWKRLEKSPHWNKLKKKQQVMLKLGFPHRHFRLSYAEIAELLECSIRHAKRKIEQLQLSGILEKENRFLKRKGRETGIHKRNYYVFTEYGKALIDVLIQELFPDDKKMSPRNSYSSNRYFCQVDFSNPANSWKEKIHIEKSDSLKEVEISKDKATIFELYNLHTRAEREFSPVFKIKINNTSLKLLVKFLKWITKKLKKGYHIIHFGKFFNWLLKHSHRPISWLEKRSKDYFRAIQTKTALGGVDSDAVIEQVLELQKQTGLKINEKELHGVLRYGAQHLRAALKFTLFRAKRVIPRHWIKFLYFVLRKSIIEISKMCKSEEKIRHERKSYDKEIQQQEKQSDSEAWNSFYEGCADDEKIQTHSSTEDTVLV